MRALITGVLGQDGSYLSEHLLSLGYEVHGIARFPIPTKHTHFIDGVYYHYGDMVNEDSLSTVIRKSDPDEIYNLAGQVFVPESWIHPSATFDVNVGGLARILNVLELQGIEDKVKVYQASTSEMYGNILKPRSAGVSTSCSIRLDENIRMHPVSPYGISKHAAHELVRIYREKGMFVCSGILFNHESPRRGHEMLTRKVTRHIAQWARVNKKLPLCLGAHDSKRDWGFAGDYVKAMHLMLQQDKPDDYVIGTGIAHSVEEFVNLAMKIAGIVGEVQYNCLPYNRPNELQTLVADYGKANRTFGWKPEHSFEDLVTMMVEADLGMNMKLFGEARV